MIIVAKQKGEKQKMSYKNKYAVYELAKKDKIAKKKVGRRDDRKNKSYAYIHKVKGEQYEEKENVSSD